MAPEIQLYLKVIVHREMINRINVSLPKAERLAQFAAWASLDETQLAAAIRAENWEISGQSQSEFHSSVQALHAKLKTISTDAVWLVPPAAGCKCSYKQHMLPFQSGSARSLIATGLRDSWQNMFKFVWRRGLDARHACRPCEPLQHRQYPVLYCRSSEPGRLRGGQACLTEQGVSVQGETFDVGLAIAAAPLVEDGCLTPLTRRLGFESDLRHEFHVRPSEWREVLPPLQRFLFSADQPELVGTRILQEAERRGLKPEQGYYLSSLGVRQNGDLILISMHGSVSSLAQAQLDAGAVYALLTEEGGSCATAVWQNAMDHSLPDHVRRDVNGSALWQPEPVIFGTNSYFRPQALALCVVELSDFFIEPPFVE